MLPVVYSLSSNGYVKEKFPEATKIACMQNAINVFGVENIHVLVDETNLDDHLREQVNKITKWAHLEFYTGGSSSASWRRAYDYIISNIADVVYRVEDDYLHRDGTPVALLEALENVHYCTGYQHGDRFISALDGGSQFSDGGFKTYLFKTKSSYWSLVESTTLSFATTKEQLLEDYSTWNRWCWKASHPNDFRAFSELTQEHGRQLASALPSYCTHAEPRWQAPLIGTGLSSWEDVLHV